MCLPVAGALPWRRWPRGGDGKPSPFPLPAALRRSGQSPPCCRRHLRVLGSTCWSLPMARALMHRGHGDPRGQGSLPQLPPGLGTRGGQARGQAAAAWFFGGSFPCPTLQLGGLMVSPPGWENFVGGPLAKISNKGSWPRGGLRSLRAPPTPCLSSRTPRTEQRERLGRFAAGLGQSWAQAAEAGAEPGPSEPRRCDGAKLPRAELEGPRPGSRRGWAAPRTSPPVRAPPHRVPPIPLPACAWRGTSQQCVLVGFEDEIKH